MTKGPSAGKRTNDLRRAAVFWGCMYTWIRAFESKDNLKKHGCHDKFIELAYDRYMRVLIAEDKPRMARFLQRALQSEGYAVELAFDGEEALSMGLLGGLDLLVLDVMLPRRDGFDVIRNLRAAKQMFPTIIVTARDAMSDIVRG